MAPPEPSQRPETLDIQRTVGANGWSVVESRGSAAAFHHTAPPDDPGAQIWVHRIPRPALVLGSTQPDQLVHRGRAERAGIEVCRRRSGGGLVFIDPEADCWIDVIIPSHSGLWSSDVGVAFHWVGHVWASLLNVPGIVVSEQSTRTTLGRVWCFADLGHGEVSANGSKVVGLSQRRTRGWTRIQCLVLGSWNGEGLRSYVDLDWLVGKEPALFPDADELDPALVRAGIPPGLVLPPPTELAEQFISAVPDPG